MNKTFTTIIPTWNRAECLRKCLTRVISQGLFEMEIIVSDDGSTDNTEAVVATFQNSNIKYIFDQNSTLPAITRNRALKQAQNEIIAFCDSDDYWSEFKLKTQLKILNSEGVSASCSNAF